MFACTRWLDVQHKLLYSCATDAASAYDAPRLREVLCFGVRVAPCNCSMHDSVGTREAACIAHYVERSCHQLMLPISFAQAARFAQAGRWLSCKHRAVRSRTEHSASLYALLRECASKQSGATQLYGTEREWTPAQVQIDCIHCNAVCCASRTCLCLGECV